MNFDLNLHGPIKHLPTDFVIVSQNGKEISCHKFVLAMASPVFDAMFDMKDSKEVLEGKIEIKDASDQALEEMVQFMYSQKFLDDQDLYDELLILSNKYNLKYLASKILPRFVQKIDFENCIDAYIFGFVHEYEDVKTAAFHIIAFNWDILQAEESKTHPLSKFHPKEYEMLQRKMKFFDYIRNFRDRSQNELGHDFEAKHLSLSNNITCKPLPQYLQQGFHPKRSLQEILQ